MKKHEFYDKPEKAYYPGFIIFNQQKEHAVIGFCPQGWYLSCSSFWNYIHNYVIKFDYNKSSKNLRKIQGRGYDFDISQDYGDYEMSLLSEEFMDLELKHFLDGIEITDKIKQEVYYPEMVRRGYIDILSET